MLCLCVISATASKGGEKKEKVNAREGFNYELQELQEEVLIRVDGVIDDEEWGAVAPFSKFINKWPVDSGFADIQTSVKLTYDDNFVYVSSINYQKREDVVIQTLKRDNQEGHWGSDGFTVVIDPLNQRSNGYLFGVNAGGAQAEGTLTLRGTQTRGDLNWDNKWYSATRVYDDYWVAEMAIPFNALRYDTDNHTWAINFIRHDMKNNVYSTWAQVPIAFNGVDLGYMGTITWDQPPKATSGNVIVIPYVAGSSTQDFEDDESDLDADVGLDAKIALSSSLNLDLTVNPDFSNVDVDQQQTNLTQFSLFFPERRGFFLENSDLFSNYGSWGITPFFSRRIGLDGGEAVPILFGARLTGNLNESLRIGVMDVQTNATDDLNANNYFVASAQQQILERSRIKVLATNRQGMNNGEGNADEDYNRAGGVEFDYVSPNGQLTTTVKYHAATDEEKLDDNSYYTIGTNFNNGKYFLGAFYHHLGENYIPDLGFVPQLSHYDPVEDTTIRVGFNRINFWLGHNIRPKKGPINVITINPWTVHALDQDGKAIMRNFGYWSEISFKSRHQITIDFTQRGRRLIVPAEFVDDATPLPTGFYDNSFYRIEWQSDGRKMISGGISLGRGKFYTGHRTELRTNINFRQQPWGNFGVRYVQNRVELGEQHGETTLHLLGPTAEITFSNTMFWTTFLQYNTQAENFNINSRFQVALLAYVRHISGLLRELYFHQPRHQKPRHRVQNDLLAQSLNCFGAKSLSPGFRDIPALRATHGTAYDRG